MVRHNCVERAPKTIVPSGTIESVTSGEESNKYTFVDPENRFEVDLRYWEDARICDLISEDYADFQLASAGAVTMHPSMHELLNNCIANINWFSTTYGNGYGDIEVIAHTGAERDWFTFSGAPNVIRPGETWVTADVKRYLSQGVRDGSYAGPTSISNTGLTEAQWGWLRDQSRLGMGFKINGSWHYHDRAFDIHWIGWRPASGPAGAGRRASRPCDGIDEANSTVEAYRRLVAVEAGLRKYFGTVLNRNWPNHVNHFHVDNGPCVGLELNEEARYKSSDVMFIQSCIEAFTDVLINKDGKHQGFYGATRSSEHREQGRLTKEGYRILLSDLGMESLNPETSISHYYLLLDLIMMHGFANERAGVHRWAGIEASWPPA